LFAAGFAPLRARGGFGYRFRNSSMDDLARVIEKYVDTPVFDETGVEGGYDHQLHELPGQRAQPAEAVKAVPGSKFQVQS
jgi:uncharacterized protein (TIGR03435 family)